MNCSTTTGSVTSSPSTVGKTTATLSFQLTLTSGILSSGDYFTITIPSPGALTSAASVTCTISLPTTMTATTCSVISSGVVQIAGPYTYGTIFKFTLSQFTNPPSQSPLVFTVQRYNSAGSNTETGSITLNSLSAGTMTSASLAPSATTDNYVGLDGATMKVTFVTSQPLSASGRISLTLPVWNSQAASQNQKAMISTSAPTCTGVTNVSPSSCSYSNNVLTLYSVVSTSIASGNTFTFTVNSVYNPYNGKPLSGFILYTQDSTGYAIESYSGLTYTVSLATSFSYLALSNISPTTIGSSSTYTITYSVDLPIDSSCQLVIVGPSEVDLTTSFQMAKGSNYLFSSSSSSATANSATNTLTIGGCSSYEETDSDSIEILYAVNPGQVQSSSAFKIYLYALIGTTTYAIASDTSQLYIDKSILTAGALSSVSVSATTTSVVQETTPYLISFTIANKLLQASVIKIQFPTSDSFFKLTSTSSCTLSSISGGCLTTSPGTCIISSANLITITYPFGTNTYCSADTDLQFAISEGVNPTSVKDAGYFTFNTYNTISSVSYSVDYYYSNNLFTPTAGTISSNLLVTSTSYTTYDQPVTYTIQFTPAHTIPLNGILKITIPLNSISVYSTTSVTNYIQVQTDSNTAVSPSSVTYASSTGVVTISNAFSGGAWTPGTTGTKLKVSISGLVNPTSLKQSQSFSVETEDSSGYTIDSISLGLSIIMTGINELNSVTVVPTSLVNGYTTIYTITVNSKTPMVSTDMFTLTFPSEVSLPGNPLTCAVSSTTPLLTAVSCVQSSGYKVTATLTFSGDTLASGSSFAFTISGVKNPESTKPSSYFTSIYTTDSSAEEKSQYSTSILIQTTTPATMLSPSLSQTSEEAGASTTYTFSFTTVNPIATTGIFVLTYPSGVTVTSVTTCMLMVSTTPKTMSCSLNSSVKQITGYDASLTAAISSGTALQLILGPITNPTSSIATSFEVITYTDSVNYYSIDKISTGLVLTILCTTPCNACLSTDSTKCTSCYTDGSTQYEYLYSYGCLTSCPTGYYSDSSYVCYACDSRCLTCSASSTCLTCDESGSYPYYYSNYCYASCPSNSYSSGYDCYACTTPCLACTGSENGECTSCLQTTANTYKYLYGTTCESSCPSSTYASTNNVCTACTSPCATCSGSGTTCLSCDSGYSLYSSGCLSSCPSGYLDQSQVCTKCTLPCSTCSNSLTDCSTCVSGYSLDGNTCLSNCNSGYVSISNSCKACTSPCLTCIITQTSCLSCATGYNLQGTACQSSCSSGYIAVNQVCVACTSPCATCSTSQAVCNSCVNGYYLSGTSCVTTCPTGYIASSSACVECSSPCATCSGSTTYCTSCITNYYLNSNSCSLSCTSGYVAISNVCQLCTSPCSTCSITQATCSTCVSGYYLSGTSCVTSCSTGYIAVNSQCVACTSPCLACSGTQTGCTSCVTGYSLSSSSCVSSCASGTVSINQVCQTCTSPCSTCTSTQSTCSSCVSGYYKSGTSCVLSCPSGYVPVDGVCTACTSPCLTCTISATVCLTCKTSYYLYGTSCVTSCPTSYIQNTTTMICDGCDPNCLSCISDDYICDTCFSGFILFENTCYTSCPTGYTYSSTTSTCVATSSSTSSSSSSSSSSTTSSSSSSSSSSTTSSSSSSTSSSSSSSSGTTSSSSSKGSSSTSSSSSSSSSGSTSSSSSGTSSTTSSSSSKSANSSGTSSSSSSSTNQSTNSTNTSSADYQYLSLGQLYYFPFMMTASIGHLVSVGSYFRDPTSSIVSNSIAFQSPVETIAKLSQIGLAFYSETHQIDTLFGMDSSSSNSTLRQLAVSIIGENSTPTYQFPLVTIVTVYSFTMLILINIVHTIAHCFSKSIHRDEKFIEWKKKHRSCYCCIQLCSCFVNFKIGRLMYSRFLGHDKFNAAFNNNSTFFGHMNCFSILSILLCLLPLIFIDVWGLAQYGWGSQFYIAMIETLIMAIIMAIMLIIDFKSGNKKVSIQNEENKKMLDDTSQEPLKLGEVSSLIDKKFMEHKDWIDQRNSRLYLSPDKRDEDIEKMLRRDALENIIKSLPRNQLQNRMGSEQQYKIEESMFDQIQQRRFSHRHDQESAIEDDNRGAFSYPVSPKSFNNNFGEGPMLNSSLPFHEKEDKYDKIQEETQEVVQMKSDRTKSKLSESSSINHNVEATQNLLNERPPSQSDHKFVKNEEENMMVMYPDNCYSESKSAVTSKKNAKGKKTATKDVNSQADMMSETKTNPITNNQELYDKKEKQDILDQLKKVKSSNNYDDSDEEGESKSVISSSRRANKKVRGKPYKLDQDQLNEVLQDQDEPEEQIITDQDRNVDTIQEEQDEEERMLLDEGTLLPDQNEVLLGKEYQNQLQDIESYDMLNDTASPKDGKMQQNDNQVPSKQNSSQELLTKQESMRSGQTKMSFKSKNSQIISQDKIATPPLDYQTKMTVQGDQEPQNIKDLRKFSSLREETKLGQKVPYDIDHPSYMSNQEQEEEEDQMTQEEQMLEMGGLNLEEIADEEMKIMSDNLLHEQTPNTGSKKSQSKSKLSRPSSVIQSRLSKKRGEGNDQDEEEKKIIDEMRTQNQSKVNNWVSETYQEDLQNQQQQLQFKAISKLSKYADELGIKSSDEEENEQDELPLPGSKLSNMNIVDEEQVQDGGRITAMINKFEEDNPDILEEEQKLLDQRLSPIGVDCPPIVGNRNFNENDILGDFERDNRGNIILLEGKDGEIIDKNGSLVNEKGYLIDGESGNVIEKEDKRTMFRKSELDDMGELPAPFSIEKHNFNPLEILGHLDYNPQTLRAQSILEKDGNLVDKNNRLVNRSGFMVDPDGNLVDRKGRKKFDRRLLIKNDDLPQLLNYKGKKFDIRDVIGDFERDKNSGDAIIKSDGNAYRDKQNRLVNQRGYLVDKDGNIIDRKGKRIFDKVALSQNGEFPKIFPFSKFNIDSIMGDFEVDPLGNPILFKDGGSGKNKNVLRDNSGRKVNARGYLIDDQGDVIDKRGNKVFDKKLLTPDQEIPKVFRKGILRKDSGDSFSRIMSEIEELERRQGSDYENEYPVSPGKPKAKKNQPKGNANKNEEESGKEEDEDEDGGNTSIESMMEDTPSNYNIANQRFEQNYYDVEEIEEDGKEQKYDDNGKRIPKFKLKKKIPKMKKKKQQKKQEEPIDKFINTDRDALMGQAYGERVDKTRQGGKGYFDQSKLSNLGNSLSGFYRDQERQHDGGLSTRMKESEIARKIPNHKEKRNQNQRKESNDNNDHNNFNNNQDQSMMSLYTHSQANFQTMMNNMYKQGGENGGGGKKRLRGMESIYLQRLEPSVGRIPKKGVQGKSKARFRECHDRVHNDPELLAEDLTIKDELEGLISDNYRNMASQFETNVPGAQRYVDLKKYHLLKDKLMNASSHDSGALISGRTESNQFDEDGLNIFHGNRKTYEKEKYKAVKVEFGKKKKN